MSTLVRMSEATALALHASVYLASQPRRRVTVTELAGVCRASVDHMNKVCQRLTRAKIITSRRGQHGGLNLGPPAGRLRLARIYELFEGRLGGPACLLKRSACQGLHAGQCVFSQDLAPIHAQIHRYLRGTSLATVAARCHPPRSPRKAS